MKPGLPGSPLSAPLCLLVLFVAAALSMADPPRTGQAQPIAARTVALEDWRLSRPSDLRLGQVGLLHQEAGLQLEVYRLRDHLPRAFPDRVQNHTPSFTGNSLLVSDFTSGNQNLLGGFFNTFERLPSRAQASLAAAADGRRGLRLSYQRQTAGFCGLWIHLFDFRRAPEERRYLNTEPFSTLSFWVRGEEGGEGIALKIADALWERKEDSILVGDLAAFLPSGRVETRWQQALVPLGIFSHRIDRSSLASVVLESMSPGSGQIHVSRMAFSVTADSLPGLPDPAPPAADLESLGQATWVWNTAELLDDGERRDSLLHFLSREGFDRVFLQLPDDPANKSGEIELDAPRLRPLVAALNRRGIRVYALDGFSGYALPSFHPQVLGTVDNIIQYNLRSDEEERFFGIRHDIEPYLLPGFQGPRREEILRSFLDLVAESAGRAREAGMVYGVDIPFWYDASDEYTYEAVTVEFRGARKPASHHVIDLVDDLAIMDYRTTAYGADGTIRHAEGELAYAAELGKPVFVGLETSPLPDEELYDFRGEPTIGELETPLPLDYVVVVPRGDSARVFLVPATRIESDLSGVYAELSAWAGHQDVEPDSLLWWPVRRRLFVPGDKLTFTQLGARRLLEVMEETAYAFRRYDSFAGFALHHAQSYMELLASGGDEG